MKKIEDGYEFDVQIKNISSVPMTCFGLYVEFYDDKGDFIWETVGEIHLIKFTLYTKEKFHIMVW